MFAYPIVALNTQCLSYPTAWAIDGINNVVDLEQNDQFF